MEGRVPSRGAPATAVLEVTPNAGWRSSAPLMDRSTFVPSDPIAVNDPGFASRPISAVNVWSPVRATPFTVHDATFRFLTALSSASRADWRRSSDVSGSSSRFCASVSLSDKMS